MGLIHQAAVPWPVSNPQQDWVDQVCSIESWLEQYIGAKDQEWTWVNNTECAAVAFKQSRSATLFCLRWAR